MGILNEQKKSFFNTFGFLAFPELLADCINEIIDVFETIWAQRGGGHNGQPHDGMQRSCIVPFIDQHERLCALLDDPRINGILAGLLGENFNYMGSDGNYYAGDTQWHSDGWGKEIRFVKIALYLDPLTRDTGCLRVIPGSHHLADQYANDVENTVRNSPEQWDIHGPDVPALALETNPGDVVVFNHNLKHAAFGGSPRRRMFTINCSERFPEDEEHIALLKTQIAARARFWNDRAYSKIMVATAGPERKKHLTQVMAHDDHLAELSARAREEMPEPSRG